MAEWLIAVDCKSVENDFYVGSNPTFSINLFINKYNTIYKKNNKQDIYF